MKRIILLAFLGMLIFGCIGEPQPAPLPASNASTPAQQNLTPNITQNASMATCTPEYSFSGPAPAVLGGKGMVTMSATCAAGKDVSIYVDGELQAGRTVSSERETITFGLDAVRDGMVEVQARSGSAILRTMEWNISSIGFTEVSGMDTDPVTIKQWKAVAFDIAGSAEVGSASFYLKRFQFEARPDSRVRVELQTDAGGSPSNSTLANGSVLLRDITMSDKWMKFEFDKEVPLGAGRYWLVIKVVQPTSPLVTDMVNVRYVTVDKQEAGNAFHRQMELVRNETLDMWLETEWLPLTYDRNYLFMVSSG